MKNWTSSIERFLKDESGATAIEYGLIAGLISVVIAGSVGLIGGDLKSIFETISGKLGTAATAAKA